MGVLSPPLRVGSFDPVVLVDTVVRWGPVSILTAKPPVRIPRILVEDYRGVTPASFRRTAEPRC